MMVQVDASFIFSLFAAAASLTAVAAYFNARKRAAVEEGKHLESITHLKDEISRHDAKLEELDSSSQTLALDVREVKTDIKNILHILESKGGCN